MRRTLARDLGAVSARRHGHRVCTRAVRIASTTLERSGRRQIGLDSLRQRIYACYAWEQSHVAVDGDTLDRLSILGALGRTEDAERRRRLFLALDPVWRSVNRNSRTREPLSPADCR